MRGPGGRERTFQPDLPKHTEDIRSKLKRLVSHGLAEPEPGLFTLPRP
ncbi:hypothetical protein [Streptomyces sp. NBC_00154]|nr:hypothetical protein [Streptomyces sp. NBC_00154]MCX5315469.1 hypothetical protein [Streptomyces sp. NBC_00154]